MKHLYSKIMEASTTIVKIPFLTTEEKTILRNNHVSYQKVGNEYLVNVLQAKTAFTHC